MYFTFGCVVLYFRQFESPNFDSNKKKLRNTMQTTFTNILLNYKLGKLDRLIEKGNDEKSNAYFREIVSYNSDEISKLCFHFYVKSLSDSAIYKSYLKQTLDYSRVYCNVEDPSQMYMPVSIQTDEKYGYNESKWVLNLNCFEKKNFFVEIIEEGDFLDETTGVFLLNGMSFIRTSKKILDSGVQKRWSLASVQKCDCTNGCAECMTIERKGVRVSMKVIFNRHRSYLIGSIK